MDVRGKSTTVRLGKRGDLWKSSRTTKIPAAGLPVMPQSKYQRVREFLLLHFAPHGVPEVTWKRPASMILFRARFVQVFAAARTIRVCCSSSSTQSNWLNSYSASGLLTWSEARRHLLQIHSCLVWSHSISCCLMLFCESQPCPRPHQLA